MDQIMPGKMLTKLLTNSTTGTLSLNGEDGASPVSVPVTYLFFQGQIYILSLKRGEKLDAIRRNPHATFSVICEEKIVPQYFLIEFKSIIVKGTACIVEDPDTISTIIQLYMQRFYYQFIHRGHYYVDQMQKQCTVIRIDADSVVGKIRTADTPELQERPRRS